MPKSQSRSRNLNGVVLMSTLPSIDHLGGLQDAARPACGLSRTVPSYPADGQASFSG